jgi:hypothetical protein
MNTLGDRNGLLAETSRISRHMGRRREKNHRIETERGKHGTNQEF